MSVSLHERTAVPLVYLISVKIDPYILQSILVQKEIPVFEECLVIRVNCMLKRLCKFRVCLVDLSLPPVNLLRPNELRMVTPSGDATAAALRFAF